MTYEVKYTSRFKKDYKLLKKRGYDMDKLLDVVDMLREGRELPAEYKDHPLRGDYVGHRDCHIEPDWVLIYFKSESTLVLSLTRTGTHSDVFYRLSVAAPNNFLLYLRWQDLRALTPASLCRFVSDGAVIGDSLGKGQQLPVRT